MSTALVTGAGSGIGAAIAARLAADGMEVIVSDRDGDAAARHADAVNGRGLELDVTDLDAVRRAIDGLGQLEVLVNNAGEDDELVEFTDTEPERWRRMLSVNLEGTMACTHAALPAMQSAGYGRIVNVSSEAGRIGANRNAAYAAAKGGVIAFTKAVARENARRGITCNCIAPGPIDTPLLRRWPSDSIERVEKATLVRRLGKPQEVAAAVAFLASEEASYITGETLGVSGGMGIGA